VSEVRKLDSYCLRLSPWIGFWLEFVVVYSIIWFYDVGNLLTKFETWYDQLNEFRDTNILLIMVTNLFGLFAEIKDLDNGLTEIRAVDTIN
jgi:hypothetical protein